MTLATERPATADPHEANGVHNGDGGTNRFERTVALVGALVVLVALMAFAGSRVKAPDTHTALLFGDSITDISGQAFHGGLDGEFSITVSGVGGARVDQRLPDVATFAGLHTSQVVINLGTNDLMQQRRLEDTEHDLLQTASSFTDARCIHLVTMNIDMFSFAQPDLSKRAQELNRWIINTAADHGWDVVRWDLEVHQYDLTNQPFGPITSDTIHPTEAGRRRLAELYRQALNRC